MIASIPNQQNTWTHTTLNEFCGRRGQSIEPCKTPDSQFELYSVPSFPARQPEIVSGKEVGSNKQMVTQESVLLCKINPRINRAWVVGHFSPHTKIASTEWIVFPPDQRVDSRFLCYFLQQNAVRDFLAANVSGVGGSLMRVKASTLRDFPFAYPDRLDQKRIVAEIEKQFSRLDEAVANLKRVKANLKRYKASVLKAAVEGKLTEDWRKQHPNVEPASKLLERILTERRAKWKGRVKYKEPSVPDTAILPSLPPDWVWVSPAQLSSADTYSLAIGPFGSNLKVSDYTDSGVPLIFVRNIRSLDFGDERRVYVSKRKAAELKAHGVSGGDVLVTKMGDPPGDACLYPEQAPDAIITADCIKLRLSRMLPEKRLMVHAINAEVVKTQILAITKGVAQMKVSLARFGGIGIPLPPLAEQQLIVAEVERRLSVIDELEGTVEANLTRAEHLRQSVLRSAFSGRLVDSNKTTANSDGQIVSTNLATMSPF